MLRQSASGWRWLWISILILLMDQYAKYWVLNNLSYGEPLYLLPFFNLTLAYNKGAAFSFLDTANGWQNYFFGGVAFIVSVLILYWLVISSWRKYIFNIGLCLILGGAIGNALDRARLGFVVDFFDFHITDWHFAIFNIADAAICVGAFLVALHWLRD